MRKRVEQWQAALDLAYALSPAEVVPLSFQRAQVCLLTDIPSIHAIPVNKRTLVLKSAHGHQQQDGHTCIWQSEPSLH